ncbi:cell wall protein DAN4-like [Haliotis rubra]|uniref:cell wall protein DAN4-like n=1 Tax=Haliotis rubra TaxID=36100 RepID=UPI001EE51ED7|nr:cell wall protein DAN4-like [Haliotis rubra]
MVPTCAGAFERDKTSSNCTLIFSPSPYVCESQVPQDDTETAARNCLEFSDITGKKEKIVESDAPVSACVSTVKATTPATTAATTTEPLTTTSITTPTTTEADSTQSTTSSTGGVESTHTEASLVTNNDNNF